MITEAQFSHPKMNAGRKKGDLKVILRETKQRVSKSAQHPALYWLKPRAEGEKPSLV